MPLDEAAITQQQKLLADHRQRLALFLEQQAKYGVATPPHVIIDIREAQAAIRAIKAVLREGGAPVADEPNDDALPTTTPAAPPPSPPAQQSITAEGGGTISGVTQRNAQVGGDYAEGNIDSRQGTFIEKQIVQPALAPTLHPRLRAPVEDFVGRAAEIDRLEAALRSASSGATIRGLRGMGGIGKTELALVVAHRLTDAYPDQILIELRGALNPITATQALQTAIHAFDREAKLPDDLNELRNAYCSVLAGKRVLILADDAKDAVQVRSLLPPPGCALLVTSRYHFPLPGMTTLDLSTLPASDAEKLLLEIGPRIGEHAGELAKLCGYLPLALRVSAGVLANSNRSVGRYLKQLAAERLKNLSDPDDPTASVEASLQLSYDALEPAAQAALCQLSVFPTSFDQAAALAVVEVDGDAEALLELLGRRSLLEWDATAERYSLHDLVRVFAAARLVDADAVRLRHARHFVRVASLAEGDLYLKGAVREGLALFDRERTHINTGWGWALAHAGGQEADALLRHYSNATVFIGELRYDNRRERIPQLEAALAAARRIGDRGAEGNALGNLGNAYAALGDARKAIAFYEQHLAVARELGDRRGEGNALGNLGSAYADLGDARKAITFHEQALVIDRELGDRRGEGAALGNLGLAYAALGDARKAITFYEQALVIDRELGDRRGEGAALGNLGLAYAALGDARKAIAFYEQHLAVARELGDRRGAGNALGNLGLAYADLGDARKAIAFYEQHLAVAREIGDRQGESIASWNLGLALEKQGDLARAAELMQVCVDFERDIGHSDAEKDAARLEQLRQRIAVGDGGTTDE